MVFANVPELPVKYRLLGTLKVSDGFRWTSPGGPKQRAMVALLLVNRDTNVKVSFLIDELWRDQPPKSARNAVQVYVHQIRVLLAKLKLGTVERSGSTYRLILPAEQIDAYLFEHLVAQGRRELDSAYPSTAISTLTRAAELWRGSPLSDVPETPSLSVEASRLQDNRALMWMSLVDAKLSLGRHQSALSELDRSRADARLREDLWARRMVALYSMGRRIEALATYRELRQLLVHEVGVDPTPQLQDLHHRMLNEEPAETLKREIGIPPPPTDGVGSRPARISISPFPQPEHVPAELPTTIGPVIGRTSEIGEIVAALVDSRQESPRTVAITGPPGHGMTTLAVHCAREVVGSFPDGQLYFDLRGHNEHPPLEPHATLVQILRSLGVPSREVPDDQQRAAAMFRTLLAGKRVLLVLDDARSVSQVRPLIPAEPRSRMLITSCSRLVGLKTWPYAKTVELRHLTSEDSVTVLTQLVDQRRADQERDAVAELAHLCGYVPLALSIAGAKIAARPGTPIHRLVESIREYGTFDQLRLPCGDASVRATLDRSYEALDPLAQRLFRWICIAPDLEITPEAAAAMLPTTLPRAESLLDELFNAYFVEIDGAGGFSAPDVLREYGCLLTWELDSRSARAAAVQRLLSWNSSRF